MLISFDFSLQLLFTFEDTVDILHFVTFRIKSFDFFHFKSLFILNIL